jgi:hypothetical protein
MRAHRHGYGWKRVRLWESTDGEALMENTWNYRHEAWSTSEDVVGYKVLATDGPIGEVDEATSVTDRSYLVVDTGFWIFGKKRLIPAGIVTEVDPEAHSVTVSLSKAQVKAAPDYDESVSDDDLRSRHDDYYGPHSW